MMWDAIRSALRFSWSMSLFGLRQGARLVTPGAADEAAGSFDAVTRAMEGATREPPPGGSGGPAPPPGAGGPPGGRPAPSHPPPAPPGPPPDPGRLDPSRFVVLGEGLAAGMSDFGLKADLQQESFPARAARAMGVQLPLPLIEAPGIGDLPGFPRLPVRVPAMMQTTVREDLEPAAPPQNLAIPGLRLADALEHRPTPPVVHREDARQTAVNLLLGMPGLLRGDADRPTALEAAVRLRPTLALVELGFAEALAAATEGEPDLLPASGSFRSHLDRLLGTLRGVGAEVVVATVPDPLDTAHFSSLDAAGRVLKATPAALAAAYGLAAGDRITVRGLVEIGCQILAGSTRPLPPGSVLSAATADRLTVRLAALRQEIVAAAQAHGAQVLDLHGLLRAVREIGVDAGQRRLSADFLGGFYTLNGYYPGRTGHALIANGLLDLLNRAYGARFPLCDLGSTAAADPVARYRQPDGPQRDTLPPPSPAPLPVAPRPAPRPASGTRAAADADWPPPPEPPRRLQLPPDLQQTLPLVKRASYHGDAIRIVDCPDPRTAQYGACGDLFFGGVVLFDSHLEGDLCFRFSPPSGDVTRFEIRLANGRLGGDNGVLVAPQFFRWPVLQSVVEEAPGMVSSGELNLATGEVSNLQIAVRYLNSALFALMRTNPDFPQVAIVFPGQYGSAWARFDQRPDGRLDFTFFGSTFLPLGAQLGRHPTVWALPFSSPTQDFAAIPASGMAMHPHLHLSTREPEEIPGAACPELPFNSIQELTLYTRNTSFGDQFTLNSDELGGYAKGRSQLMGRLEVQIGEPFGDSVSVAISSLSPGGLLVRPEPSPIAAVFPGRLYDGPIGHNEFLRYPRRTYFLDAVGLLDDPFDLAVGAVDLRTGCLLNELLRRGFIAQNVFYALVRVEPRTPQGSFLFRGPARFEAGADGRLAFRLKAEVHIPYPEGFLYPAPDLATAFPIGPGSALDPFLWMQARQDADRPARTMAGEEKHVRASSGEEFSYRFSIPPDPGCEAAIFEYTNHSQEGSFRLQTLAWVGFTNALDSRGAGGGPDTVTFSGYGTWSKDGGTIPHIATVQIARPSDGVHYVSIQIGSGLISNVNTKPMDERNALP